VVPAVLFRIVTGIVPSLLVEGVKCGILLFWNGWVPVHKLCAGSYCVLEIYPFVVNSAFRHIIWPRSGPSLGLDPSSDPN
jgi:hypothetical protein